MEEEFLEFGFLVHPDTAPGLLLRQVEAARHSVKVHEVLKTERPR